MVAAALVIGMVLWLVALARTGRTEARLGRIPKTGQKAWKVAAEQLGLSFAPWGLHGDVNDFEIRVELVEEESYAGHKHPYTHVLLADRIQLLPDCISLRKETIRTLTESDIRTGDAPFDRDVHIWGNQAMALALLDRETRQIVRRCVDEGIVVTGGQVSWKAFGVVESTKLVRVARSMVECASALRIDPVKIPEKFARIATTGPDEAVRLSNLTLLQLYFRDDDLTRSASHSLLDSANPQLRLQAAQFLGEEGVETLAHLAEQEGIDVAVRRKALDHLSRSPGPQAGPILARSLNSSISELQRLAIEGVARLRYHPAVGALVALLERVDADTTVGIIVALQQIGDLSAEPALIRCLEHDSDSVRIAAAQALEYVGTVVAVEHLMRHAKGVFADAHLKRAALAAIEHIQSRLGNVDEGRLSLTELGGRQGQLALAGQEGQLSMPKDERVAGAAPPSAAEPPQVQRPVTEEAGDSP